MKSKKSMSKEDQINQCKSPFSEHEMSNLIKNASFSKVTVRRKPEKTVLELVEEEDSVNAVPSMQLKQSYNCKNIELYKEKGKNKKKKEKSCDNFNGLFSDDDNNLFKPKKKKQITKIKSKTKNFCGVELANDISSSSLKKKKKRDTLIDLGQAEFFKQTCYDEHSIAEVVSTSLTKNYTSQLEDNDLQCVVHKTEITHGPSAENILESEGNSDNEVKSQTKHSNNKRKNYFINEDECVVENSLSPTKSDDNQRNKKVKTKIKNTYNEEPDVTNLNELMTNSSRKKKKHHKHIENSENVIESNYVKHNIKEANSTSLAIVSPSNSKKTFDFTKSQLLKETSDVENCALNKPERKKKKKDAITNLRSSIESITSPMKNKKVGPPTVNILESEENSDHEVKSQIKHNINKRKNESINEDECVVENTLSSTKSTQKKRKQQKHLEDSDSTIKSSYSEQKNTNLDLPITTLLTIKSQQRLKDGECDLKVDQEIDATSSAQANLQLLQQTFKANPKNSLNKKNRKKNIVNFEIDSQETEKSHTPVEVKTKPSKNTYGDDNQRKKKVKTKIKNTSNEEPDVTNLNELMTNSSRKKKKHHKHTENSENVIESNHVKHNIKEANSTSLAIVLPTNSKKTFDCTRSQLLKETSDIKNCALNKPERNTKKKDEITNLRSTIELTTSPVKNKKEKASNPLKDDYQTSGGSRVGTAEVISKSLAHESSKYHSEVGPQIGNGAAKYLTFSSGETQLKHCETYDTTEKESTNDLLGSDSSVFKFKYQSINPTSLINSTGASKKEVSKRKKKSKHVINDTDIITARLLKNALKESGTTQNTLQPKKKKINTEKKDDLLSSSNQRTLQDLSEIVPNKQKSEIGLKRKDKKMKKKQSNKKPKNEIEKMEQDLLFTALKRLKTNSVAKPSDTANLNCTKESDNSPKWNLTQTLLSKSIKKTGNKPKVVKIDKSVKKYSKLKKTKTKDLLEEITSKMLAEALARKQN